MVSINSGIEKLCASERYVTISVEVFCLTVPKIFVGEPFLLCFRKLPLTKKFMVKRRGIVEISRRNFLSHSAEKSRRGTL